MISLLLEGVRAGLSATSGCAQLGLRTALVERHRLGGDCLFHGCVPSKTLLKSASVFHHAQEFTKFGFASQTFPEPDMAAINARVQGVIEGIAKHDSSERFEGLGAEVIFGAPRFVSSHELRIDNRTISAARIILALGSGPRGIPVPGLEETGYVTNLDMFGLPKRPDAFIIIGAGPIGVEMSQAFTRLGSRVTLIDISNQILINDDPDMAAVVHERLEQEGVTLRLQASIKRVEKQGNRKAVILANGDAEETIVADEILVSTGRQGNVADLDLEQAGVRVERGFIPTDSKLRTSRKHILAIGDCNGRLLFTHVAGAEASVAVRRAALRLGGTMNYRAVPWVTYTDPEIASVGYNEGAARRDGIKYDVITERFDTNDRALAEGESRGVMKLLIDRKQHVIGAQIAAFHAGDLLLPALFAVGEGWGVRRLMNPIYPYPTLGEIYKKTVGGYMAPKLFNDKVRGLLRFLHGYRGAKK